MALFSDIRIRNLPSVALLFSWIAMLLPGLPMARGGEVAVAWSPPLDASDVSSYVVRYGTVSGHYAASTNVGTRTSALFKDLPGGLTYYFSAVSLTAAGDESVTSNEISVEVPGPPPQPTGAQNVSFAQNTTSPDYRFWLAGLNGSTNWVLLAQSSDTTLIAAEGIALSGTGSNRFVRLTPQPDRRGTSVVTLLTTDFVVTNSTSFQAEVTPANLPPVVNAGAGTTVRTNLYYTLRGRATDDGLPRFPGRLSLRWSKVTGPGTVTFGNSNFAVTSVRLGSPGLYRLRLTASDGELSASSDTIIRALLISDTTPPSIANFTVTDVNSSSLTVVWTTDEPADSQVRYYVGDNLPNFSLLSQTPRTNHQVSLDNLTSDTLYMLVARSRDSSGNETLSDPLFIRTLTPTLISAPAVLGRQQSTPSQLEELDGASGVSSDLSSVGGAVDDIRVTMTVQSGWSMMACPVTASQPWVSSVLPNPPARTILLKTDARVEGYVTNFFDGQRWFDPGMSLAAGEGGLLYNPAAAYAWTVQGFRPATLSSRNPIRRPHGGNQFFGVAETIGGLITAVLPGFEFQAGDQIRRLRPATNEFETSTFNGSRWDLFPTINVGEAIFLDLVFPEQATQAPEVPDRD